MYTEHHLRFHVCGLRNRERVTQLNASKVNYNSMLLEGGLSDF